MEATHPLRAYRKANNLTQQQLAEKLDVARTTVARWENGDRKIDDDLVSRVSERTGIVKQELRPDLALLMSASVEAAE